jgi:leader peptidase (prepilin peptidase)/N-methyltransferase
VTRPGGVGRIGFGTVSRDLLAAALTALVGVGSGLLGPWVIARLREPEVEAPGPPRPTFVEVAATPGLRWRLALAGGAVGLLVGWEVGWTPALAAWNVLTAVCLLLGYVDARTRLLPTQLIAPSYWIVVGLLLAAAIVDDSFSEVRGAVIGWLVMGGFYYVLWRLGPGLGYGDVRLSGLLALCLGFLGWEVLVTGLYSGFLLGGVVSAFLVITRRANRKTQLPFGPFMMLGALVGLAWGHSLSGWYVAR